MACEPVHKFFDSIVSGTVEKLGVELYAAAELRRTVLLAVG